MNPNVAVSDILNAKGSQAWAISPDATVFDALRTLADYQVGALMVMDGGRLVGVMSERDYTRKVALQLVTRLGGELQEKMKAGPAAAVGVCKTIAPAAASDRSCRCHCTARWARRERLRPQRALLSPRHRRR